MSTFIKINQWAIMKLSYSLSIDEFHRNRHTTSISRSYFVHFLLDVELPLSVTNIGPPTKNSGASGSRHNCTMWDSAYLLLVDPISDEKESHKQLQVLDHPPLTSITDARLSISMQ